MPCPLVEAMRKFGMVPAGKCLGGGSCCYEVAILVDVARQLKVIEYALSLASSEDQERTLLAALHAVKKRASQSIF